MKVIVKPKFVTKDKSCPKGCSEKFGSPDCKGDCNYCAKD